MTDKLKAERMTDNTAPAHGYCVAPLTVKEKEELKTRILIAISTVMKTGS